MDLAKIERLQRDQTVLDGIVQIAIFALTPGGMSLTRMRMIFRIAIAVFQREPPS